MKRIIVLIASLILSGCATTSVVTSCIKKEITKPESEFDKAPESSPLVELIRKLLIDRESSKQYEADLEAQIKGCR